MISTHANCKLNGLRVVKVVHSPAQEMHALQSTARHHGVAIFADPMPLTGSLRMAQEMRPIETCHWLRSLPLSVSKQFLNVKQERKFPTAPINRVGAEIPSKFAPPVVNKTTKVSLYRLHRLCSLDLALFRGEGVQQFSKGLQKDIVKRSLRRLSGV